MQTIRKLGKVAWEVSETQDVTQEYVDHKARSETMEATRAQLAALLTQVRAAPVYASIACFLAGADTIDSRPYLDRR